MGATATYGSGIGTCIEDLSNSVTACDESEALAVYGRLYNWHAVADLRGLCANGWHIATDDDWETLLDHLESDGFNAAALKSSTNWHVWEDVLDANGTDEYGFNGQPSGYRVHHGGYNDEGYAAYWWSSSPDVSHARQLYYLTGSGELPNSSFPVSSGLSVRCLRDSE